MIFKRTIIYPQKFRVIFEEKYNINIDRPEFGSWFEKAAHQASSHAINKEWTAFLGTNPTNEAALLKKAAEIADKYGLKYHFQVLK